jgi:hypothetical protein
MEGNRVHYRIRLLCRLPAKAGLQSANPLPTAIHVAGNKGQVAKIQAAKTTFATCHG